MQPLSGRCLTKDIRNDKIILYTKKDEVGVFMSNFIAFFNQFLSYLLLMLIIVVLCAIAFVIGTSLRKRKNRQEAEAAQQEQNAETT